MANNLLRMRLVTKHIPCKNFNLQTATCFTKAKIGKREIVGYGMNGQANYIDRADFPMPAIRFREITSDLSGLKAKEKGDWKSLSLEEKKTLYRASFCQTFAEMNAPTGDWKFMLSGIFAACSMVIWFYVWMHKYVYGPLPPSFSPEAQKAQMQRMLDLRINPIEGISSKYDFENDRWK
uniref:Cytochrome c oxidase subunit 4 n=1 Tax=Strigamia maritima TaxID=126957 RepID=T1JMD6_STRMM